MSARSGALFRTAYLMVGERGLAHDLVQEALIKTYVAWARLREPLAAEAYTRRVMTTTAIGWYRKKSWSQEHTTSEVPERIRPAADDVVAQRDWLWQELLTLPPRQRAAIVLRYYEDLSEAQTAHAMDCAVGTVKSQVAAGLKKLRERLGDDARLFHLDDLEAVR